MKDIFIYDSQEDEHIYFDSVEEAVEFLEQTGEEIYYHLKRNIAINDRYVANSVNRKLLMKAI